MTDKQKRPQPFQVQDTSPLVVYTYNRQGKQFITPNQTIAALRSESGRYTEITYAIPTQEG